MSMVRVTDIEIDADVANGLEVQITVRRPPYGYLVEEVDYDPADVPEDVRTALMDWLKRGDA